MNVLLTGGAGYIGSHVARALAAAGHRCVAYDNLSKGHRQAVDGRAGRRGRGRRAGPASGAAPASPIEAVIHLAAFIEAGESVAQPGKYFQNNTLGGLTLLEAMRECSVGKLVFSSTAAVYGRPSRLPIAGDRRPDADQPLRGEQAVRGVHAAGLRRGARAGVRVAAVLQRRRGRPRRRHRRGPRARDAPDPPRAPGGAGAGQARRRSSATTTTRPTARASATTSTWPTWPRRTCWRLGAIRAGEVRVYNLGNGEGFSVKQVIETCRQVTGKPIPAEVAPRRAGDPPRLVASSAKAAAELSWRPKFADLATIVEHAWAWHRNHPRGYAR